MPSSNIVAVIEGPPSEEEQRGEREAQATVCALFLTALEATQHCLYHVRIQSTSAQAQRGWFLSTALLRPGSSSVAQLAGLGRS